MTLTVTHGFQLDGQGPQAYAFDVVCYTDDEGVVFPMQTWLAVAGR